MCTGIRFTDPDGNMYFGRNLDWIVEFGQKVYATQRGFKHDKFLEGSIEAKYASIGTGICVDEFPLYFDAGNEKGLGCAGLNFPGYAKYADGKNPPTDKTAIPSYMFPLYIVSMYETVDEVEAALQNIVISDTEFNSQLGVSMLHWIIGDATRSIVVEMMPDGLHLHHNDIDVLANQPTFDWQMENLRNYMNVVDVTPQKVTWGKVEMTPFDGGAGMCGLPGGFYSPDRFVRAAFFNSHYPPQSGEQKNVLKLIRTLLECAQIPGAAKDAEGKSEYTIYTGGFSSATNSYYYCSYDNPAIKCYKLESAGVEGGKVVEVVESAS